MSDLLQQVDQPYSNRSTKITYIYGLIDPRTAYIRYVGKADVPKTRLALHLQPAQLELKTRKSQWLRELLSYGYRPNQIILEVVDYSVWGESEKKWISYYRTLPDYPPLTNVAPGGGGVDSRDAGYQEGVRRRAVARVGVPMPPGTGAKISKSNTGVRKSKEARASFSNGQRNRWAKSTPEEREHILNNLHGPRSAEHRKAISKRARNARRISNASSQYRNVIKVTGYGKNEWRAACIIGGKQICIGFFESEEEAARARDRYVLRYIGEDVILNFARTDYDPDPSKIIIEKRPRGLSRKPKNNTSGYKGIYKNGKNGWAASLTYMGIRYRLGTHRTREDAARAYDRKVIEIAPITAPTNFPRSQYD